MRIGGDDPNIHEGSVIARPPLDEAPRSDVDAAVEDEEAEEEDAVGPRLRLRWRPRVLSWWRWW